MCRSTGILAYCTSAVPVAMISASAKVTLTEEGLLLRKRASEIVELVEKTECELRKDEEIPAGFYPVQVEIGIQDTYNVEIKSGVNDGDTVFTQMITDQAWG